MTRYLSFHSPFILCGTRHNLFQTYMDKFPNILLVSTVLSHTKIIPTRSLMLPLENPKVYNTKDNCHGSPYGWGSCVFLVITTREHGQFLFFLFSSPPMTINHPTLLLRKDLLFSLVLLVQKIPRSHWGECNFPWTFFSSFICFIFFIQLLLITASNQFTVLPILHPFIPLLLPCVTFFLLPTFQTVVPPAGPQMVFPVPSSRSSTN